MLQAAANFAGVHLKILKAPASKATLGKKGDMAFFLFKTNIHNTPIHQNLQYKLKPHFKVLLGTGFGGGGCVGFGFLVCFGLLFNTQTSTK